MEQSKLVAALKAYYQSNSNVSTDNILGYSRGIQEGYQLAIDELVDIKLLKDNSINSKFKAKVLSTPLPDEG